ncbi:MAG TPA: LLM class F420-dependent oxidoreductase [Candidatus Eisenbacteria bacterium]|nr:LLM class F420-dependent oxidoreductase [Candidatus Eisenbacteria bacterium]
MDLGRVGIWSWHLREEGAGVAEAAAELDELGYGALWFPNSPAAFDRARALLEATRRLVVATGIVSIWTHPPDAAAAAHHELSRDHPGRFLLGLGISHAFLLDSEQQARYRRPVARMREYLDGLDGAERPVPVEERILAALGPRMLELSRDRSAGAHPYLVTVEHTRRARELLGPDRALAPEQAVVLETDPERARALGREHLSRYLRAPNYTNSWLRLGFTPEDLENGGSDRLVDGLVAWGDVDAIRERVAQHHEAGADHVCLQVVTVNPAQLPRQEWRTLAEGLLV